MTHALELGFVALGFAVLAAVAFVPPRAARLVAAALAALLWVLALRRPLGIPLAAASGAAAAALFLARAPLRAARRLLFLVPSLVLLVYVTTLLMFRAPGSPFAGERVASPQVEEALRAEYGVPRDATAFFGVYVRRLVVDGSLGPALKVQGRTVEDLLLPALPVSATLGLLALLVGTGLGLGVGLRAGLRPGSLVDQGSMALVLVGVSLPTFVVGSALVTLFSLELGWLPVAGHGSLRHLVLPTATLALPHAAYVARLARSGMVEVLAQDFVRTARAKGVPERDVVLRHALPGALLPVVSYLGPATAGILTGSFVVETLFGIPGVGQWFVKGAVNRDYSVVLGTAVLYSGLVTAMNLLVDVAYSLLDPRLRGRA